MDLVIMAAGMGSRFGGLKQLTPIDDNGNFIIDYSIYDAIRCGFNKVVFIIKQEHYELFKQTVGNRVEKHIKVEYSFQNNDNIPSSYPIPQERTKPLGTAHAILCAKDKISDNFAVINADDFYGYDAFKTVSKFLKENKVDNKYSLIGYKAINTIGENGSVKRGICITKNNKLKDIDESSIWKDNGKLLAKPLDSGDDMTHEISPDTIVSMNMFGLTKDFLNYLDVKLFDFLEKHKNNMISCEFLLPSVIGELIKENKASVDILPTTAVWYGMTYKEDREQVVNSIKKLAEKGEYPTNLWNK